jgi:hypothetical protein
MRLKEAQKKQEREAKALKVQKAIDKNVKE